MKNKLYATVAVLCLCLLAGCSQETINSASKDIKNDATVVQREAKRAERKARPQVNALKVGTRVTAALKASAKLPGTIRVDATEDGVRLRGTVQTQAQKKLAERITRDILEDKQTVQNDLEVQLE